MATPNLNITEVTASQNQKEVTINDGLTALDNAGNSSLDVSMTAGNVTLTSPQYRGYVRFNATGSPGVARTLNFPASIKRLVVVTNNCGDDLTVQVTGGGGANVVLLDGTAAIVYCDGTDVLSVGVDGTGGGPYRVATFFAGDGVDENKELTHVFAEAVDFLDDFGGSQAYAAVVAATGSVVIDIEKNGSSIGSLTFAVSTATGTFATTGGAISFAAGDRLTFVCPAAFDSLAGIAVTILGSLP